MEEMENEYRIAMFGPKNAGKTVYLTTLYSHGGNADDSASAHVMASDEPSDDTHNYLTKSYQTLCNGQWPDGTAFEQLRAVRFMITYERVQSRVNIPDVAGEVTGRGSKVESWTTAEHDLKSKILSEYSTFDGFLIFAPADDTVEGKSLEFKWEVDALLKALKERAAADGMLRRPIAVVVSKWDVVPETANSPNDESDQATEHFKKIYPEAAEALAETCETWKVFPVSATGPTSNGRPPEKLRPRGVAAPVLWLLRTADEASLRRADQYGKKHAGELFRKTGGRGSATYIQKTIDRYQSILVKSPPSAIQTPALAAITQLKGKIQERRRKRLAIFSILAIAAAAFISTSVDYLGYRSASQALNNSPQTLQELDPAITRARSYADSAWHLPGGLLGLKQSLRKLADEKETQWEKDWASRISDVVFADDVEAAKILETTCQEFRNRFPTSFLASVQETENKAKNAHRIITANREGQRLLLQDKEKLNSEQLTDWITDARKFLDNDEFSEAVARNEVSTALVRRETELTDRHSEKEWLEFQQVYSELADRPWDQYVSAKAWFAKNSQSSHAGDVTKMTEDSLAAADNKAWNEVQDYKAGNRTNFKKIVERTNEYLTKTEFERHRPEADTFRTEQFDGWDEQLYREIAEEAVRLELTEAQLQKIATRCDAYIGKSERPVAMRAEVEKWTTWYGNLRNGVTAAVELDSVTVLKGSKWHGSFYSPDVFVTVRIGSRSGRSGIKELDIGIDTTGFPENQLGPFPWKLGETDIDVSITCDDYSNDTITAKLVADAFMLRHLNRTVQFDGGKILVRLKCPNAEPPPFPAYAGAK